MDNVEEEVLNYQMTRKKTIVTAIKALMEMGYEYQGMLGMGAFGDVIQLQHCTQREQIAAKIVLQECVTEGEEDICSKMLYIPAAAILDFLGKFCWRLSIRQPGRVTCSGNPVKPNMRINRFLATFTWQKRGFHAQKKSKMTAAAIYNICSEIWQELDHENIVCLNDAYSVPETGNYVFLMDKQLSTLNDMLENPSFKKDRNSLKRAVSDLHGACRGIKYFHDRNLAHLDIKINNVLVSETDIAKICDFGSLTQTEVATNSYISPFLSRAPEALISENGHRVTVDAFKYDIYTLGILAFDLFRKEARCKSFKDACDGSNLSWTDDIYPKIFDVLEKKIFKKLVKQTFENAMVKGETIEIMRNYVRGCISLNPRDRSCIDEVLEHRLFGGPNLFPMKMNDVWIKKASKEQEDVDNTECDRILNDRRKVSTWFAEKMSEVTKVLNRFFSVFHRSRK